MSKLELKYLAPYLPYSVRYIECWKASFTNQPDLKNNRIMNPGNMGVMIGKRRYRLQYAKPILRPLSDLTREIEVNGEKFMPVVEIAKRLYNKEPDSFSNEVNCGEWVAIMVTLPLLDEPKSYKTLIHWIYQDLIKWHFDVFGLIPQDLAIDINTLK